MQRALILIATLLLTSCVAPPKEWLWQPLPEYLDVSSPLTFRGDGGKKAPTVTIPAGRYARWYENKLGFYFSVDAEISEVSYGGKTTTYKGGIALWKQQDRAVVYELVDMEESRKRAGEVATLAAWEAGDKDGFYRQGRVLIPRELMSKLGLPAAQNEPSK